MLQNTRESGCDRDLYLYWGARTRDDLYFDDEIRQLAREIDCLRYTPVLSGPGIANDWTGATGWVHEAVLSDFPDLGGMDVYASGPPPMIDAIRQSFPAAGLENGRFYFDSFEYASDGP
jgi:CDP-4-dehydro-6-deoxyglucose reductase